MLLDEPKLTLLWGNKVPYRMGVDSRVWQYT